VDSLSVRWRLREVLRHKLITDRLWQGANEASTELVIEGGTEDLKNDVHMLPGGAGSPSLSPPHALVELGRVELSIVVAVLALLDDARELLRKPCGEGKSLIIHEALTEDAQGQTQRLLGDVAIRNSAVDDPVDE
jgi:hypothetical protein